MKNKLLLTIIFLLILVSPKLLGAITQAQLDKYIKVSRGGQVLAYYQRNMVKELLKKVKIRDRKKVINELKEMLENKRILEKFNKNFRDLDETTYQEMMKFYNTEEGNKSVIITKNFSMLNKKEMEIIFQKCKIKHTKDCLKNIDLTLFNALPKTKKHLLESIAQEFDTIKIKRDLTKKSICAMNLVYKKKYQYSSEFIESHSTFNDPEYNETTLKISYLFFKDFSEDELEKISNYALSDAGRQEYELIEEGITTYTNELMKRILMLYYPSKCLYESK